jgi:hypothetical protein
LSYRISTLGIVNFSPPNKNKGCVCGTCGLAIYMKMYLKAKERMIGNSNISPCKNVIFKKSFKRDQNSS